MTNLVKLINLVEKMHVSQKPWIGTDGSDRSSKEISNPIRTYVFFLLDVRRSEAIKTYELYWKIFLHKNILRVICDQRRGQSADATYVLAYAYIDRSYPWIVGNISATVRTQGDDLVYLLCFIYVTYR